jgi:hypothetical protein
MQSNPMNGLVLRLGAYNRTAGAGIHFVLWPLERMERLPVEAASAQFRSAHIQSYRAQATPGTEHCKPPTPARYSSLRFVMDLQLGCAADSSCHDPYRCGRSDLS